MKRLVDSVLSVPELKYTNNSTRGYVTAVYYEQRRCDIVYWAPDGTKMTRKRVELPKDGDGVFHESLKPGDIVEVSFKGRTQEGMFISGVVKKNRSTKDFEADKGQDLPLSTDLF